MENFHSRLPSVLGIRVGIGLFFIYGLASAVFSAWVTGPVIDEPHYLWIGDQLLKEHNFAKFVDHPPLSPWLGALPASLFTEITNTHDLKTLFLCRLVHLAIYFGGGFCIALLLYGRASPLSAFIFSVIYCTLPSTKAIAAHHLTDTDPSVMLTLAMVWLWTSKKQKWFSSFGQFLLCGLAAMSKITSLFFLPFLVWVHAKKYPQNYPLSKSLLGATGGLILGALIAYHFQWDQVLGYVDSVKFQWHHNRIGHPMSFLGTLYQHGTPLFFIGTFLFKTPIPLLALILWAATKRKESIFGWQADWLFLIVPLCFFISLTFGKIQLGYRYLIPGILPLMVFVAIALGTTLRTKFQKQALVTLAILLILVDVRAVAFDSYLNYFNWLAPQPTNRNFSDSNNEWGQGVPKHLMHKVAGISKFSDVNFFNFLSQDKQQEISFYVGARSLNGINDQSIGPLLRSLKPTDSIAGHDIFHLTRLQLFDLFLSKRPFFQTPKPRLELAGKKELLPVTECSNKIQPEIEGLDLSSSFSFKENSTHAALSLPLIPHTKYLLMLDSDRPIKLLFDGQGLLETHPGPVANRVWGGFSFPKSPVVLKAQYSDPSAKNADSKPVRFLAFRKFCPLNRIDRQIYLSKLDGLRSLSR